MHTIIDFEDDGYFEDYEADLREQELLEDREEWRREAASLEKFELMHDEGRTSLDIVEPEW